MKKQYKIQLPKGKKVTTTNVDFEDGVMTVNVEIEKDYSNIWYKMIQEYGEAICGKKEQKYEPKDGDFVKRRSYLWKERAEVRAERRGLCKNRTRGETLFYTGFGHWLFRERTKYKYLQKYRNG